MNNEANAGNGAGVGAGSVFSSPSIVITHYPDYGLVSKKFEEVIQVAPVIMVLPIDCITNIAQKPEYPQFYMAVVLVSPETYRTILIDERSFKWIVQAKAARGSGSPTGFISKADLALLGISQLYSYDS